MKRTLLIFIAIYFSSELKAQVTNSESFDGTTFAPAGWSNTQVTPTGLWSRVTAGTNPTQAPRSGAGEAMYNCFSYGTGSSAILVTPSYDLRARGTGTPTVSFWMYRDAGYSTNLDKVDVYINTVPNLTGATALGTVYRSTTLSPAVGSAGWYQYSYNLPLAYNGISNHFILQATSDFGNNIFVDDVVWISYPCSDVGGTASGSSTICDGSTTTLSVSGYTSGSSLLWQSSPDNITWTNISGATSSTYTSSPLSSTTYFRCAATNVCTAYSTVVTTTVVQPANSGTISGPSMLCSGSSATLFLTGYSGTIQWQSSPDNITWTNISGATSSTYTSPGLTLTTYYRVIVTGVAPCSTTATSTSVSHTVTISSSGGIWKGTISTSWFTAGNWCSGTVPTSATDVFIPAGTPFSPLITGGATDPNAICRDITIYPGATLTVSISLNSFSIGGNVVNNGTINHTTSTSIVAVSAIDKYWIWLTGTGKTINGTGSFANAALDIYDNGNYTLANNISVYGIRTEDSPYGTLNFSSYTLTSTNLSQQYGYFNLNTGCFWDKIFAQQFTPALFNNQSGTWVWDLTGKVSSGNMNLQDNDWNNVRLICDPSYYIALSGITDLSLNGNLIIDPNTIVRDGNIPINLKGDWINNGTFAANSVGSGGTPTVTFNGTGPQNMINNSTSFYNITINKSSSSVTMNQNNTVTNTLTLTSGLINTGANTLSVTRTAPAAITGGGVSSYVNTGASGNLRRYIAATGSYNLPVGNANAYQLMNLNFTSANTITYIDVNFDNPSNATGTGLSLTESGYTYDYVLNNGGSNATTGNTYGGVWTVTPNAGTSNYDVTLYGRNYDNGGTVRNTVLKRTTAGPGAWTLPGTYSSSTTTSPITAVRTGLNGFSQFAIGTNTSPLPIELISFIATPNEKEVKLDWSTATETNNDYFTIERSSNGYVFESIATIKGAGNSTNVLKYNYVDSSPFNGTSYYRLKQTDFDGKNSSSQMISVNMSVSQLELGNLYPNPATAFINVPIGVGSENSEIAIYNSKGKMVYFKTVVTEEISANNSIKIEVVDFPKEIYFIKINLNDGKVLNYKFLKIE